jgi:hypothetical protein
MPPALDPADIARAVRFMLTQPERANVARLLLNVVFRVGLNTSLKPHEAHHVPVVHAQVRPAGEGPYSCGHHVRTFSRLSTGYICLVRDCCAVRGNAALQLDRQLPSLLVRPLRKEFGISDTAFSLLQGYAFAIFYTLAGLPLAGWSTVATAAT